MLRFIIVEKLREGVASGFLETRYANAGREFSHETLKKMVHRPLDLRGRGRREQGGGGGLSAVWKRTDQRVRGRRMVEREGGGGSGSVRASKR